MGTEMDRVWIRIKEEATTLCARPRPVGQAEAREIVIRLFRHEQVSPPPDEAIDYLAAELLAFIRDRKELDARDPAPSGRN